MEMLEKRVETLLEILHQSIVSDLRSVEKIEVLKAACESVREARENTEDWEIYEENALWGGRHVMNWFRITAKIPKQTDGKTPVLVLQMRERMAWENYRPQFMVYMDGKPVQGADRNHKMIFLRARQSGQRVEIYLHGYAGEDDIHWWIGAKQGLHSRETEKLYYRLRAAADVMGSKAGSGWEREMLLEQMNKLLDRIPFSMPSSPEYEAAVKQALAQSDDLFKKTDGGPQVFAVGHTHIDVAWLWTIAETRQKAARSFQTALSLMDEFPEYRFFSSQPVLYEFVKEDYPEIYAKIKEKIAAGQWEPEGAMYLEADCNLASGESLIRQLLFGKKFFEEEFGKKTDILWLPDVFGYSGNLPQILNRSGIRFFITSKISWNQYNRIPHDLFYWQGIDGSCIPCAFITTPETGLAEEAFFSTYNGKMDVQSVAGTWERFQDKGVCDTVLLPYGYGDGGGGTTREMILYGNALRQGLPGCPNVTYTGVKEYAARAEECLKSSGRAAVWRGELYLEFHRGTYTSNAEIKRNNRKMEILLHDTEFFCSLGAILTGIEKVYPQEKLSELWRRLLVQQFHDILPGSSIKEVYDDSRKEFQYLRKEAEELRRKASGVLSEESSAEFTVWNSTGMMQSGEAKFADGSCIWLENVPPFGWKTVSCSETIREESVSLMEMKGGDVVETPFYKICFDAQGWMISIYDKDYHREIVKNGGKANVLTVYEDLPYEYDNWELSPYYGRKKYYLKRLEAWTIEEKNTGKIEIYQERRFRNSLIRQKMILYTASRRIDFETEADWQEHHMFLKAEFPVEINCEEASYEIAFGNIRRPTHKNTSWDYAKYEVSAHRYADYREEDYGVALLNDCKYGYDIHAERMSISLIKAGTYPNPDSDIGCHRFTYAIFPHGADSREVLRQAENLNSRFWTSKRNVTGKREFSLVTCEREALNISAVKRAEAGGEWVIRLYEYRNARGTARLNFGVPVAACWKCNLMEEVEEKVTVNENRVEISYRPFEILTLKCRF